MESSDNFGSERKGRRGELDYRYDFLFHWAAESCSITKQDVIDSLLQEIWVRNIHDFVLKDTKRTVLLFYQAFQDQNLKSRVEKSTTSNNKLVAPNKTLVVVSEERKYPLDGIAVYYFKLNVKKMLTEDNVHRDLMVGMCDAMEEELISNFIQLLQHVYRPALESLLFFADEGPDKTRVYEEVLMAIQSLYSSLKVSENILKHDNTLLAQRQVDNLDLPNESKKRADFIRHPDTVAKAEKIATDWLSMIERENCESEMLRRDCDDDSPRDEIEYWKTRSTRLNLIQQQFNSPQVALVVQCLNVNRSKLMKRWVEALRKLTHCCHEANNNTLYLSDFENHCKTLYVWDPIRLLPTINQLLSTVRLICCVSLYYNTSERITSLLVKITNELIRSCRRHITSHGRETVWSRPASIVKPLLQDCLNLHTAYRNAYANMKHDLESYQKSVQQSQQNQQQAKEQSTLTCSEHSVFGKFDAFCARLRKIVRLYDVIDKHEILLKSRMEGLLQEEEVMDEILRRYHAAVKDITSRPYDYLNHRMLGFDQHMAEFEARLNDLKLYVGSYLERAYDPVWETAQAMRFLQKFQRIGRVIPVVAMEIKHNRILNQLLADMDRLSRVLAKFGDEPPIPNNFSPTTGKMMWCATLQRCLELRLEEHAPILHSETGRQVFRKYKNVLTTIVQLGNNHLRNWALLNATEVENCLSQNILTPNLENPQLFSVNFNPKIISLFQEVHCACQAGLKVPPTSVFIFARKGLLLKMKDEAQYLIENHKSLLDSIDPELKPLLCCHVHQLYLTLRPASVALSWNIKQSKWTRFFNLCRKSMVRFKLLCQRLEDIRINQLERILESLRYFTLCPDNRDKTWMPEEFIEAVKDACRKATSEIQQRNWLLENGVFELIDLIRVKDVMKFFEIPTETIAAQIEKGRTSSTKTPRPKSITSDRKKSDSTPDSSRVNKSPPIGQSGERAAKRRTSNGGETVRNGLPPLNPSGPTGKPPPVPSKTSQPRTKLPKLTSKRSSPTKEPKNPPTCLPPLSARSNSSLASGQDYSSRKNSVVSNEGRDEPNVVLVADYGFLVVQLEKAIIEWKKLYSKRILQVIVTWLRSQIDQMRYSVVPPPNHKSTQSIQQQHTALFLLHSQLNHTTIEMTPSLDDIQDIIHTAGKIMLCVAKGIKRWQYRSAIESRSNLMSAVRHNIYVSVSENKEVVKGLNLLSTCLIHVKSTCGEQLRQWENLCKEICCYNRGVVVKNFVNRNPSVWDWDHQLRQFRHLEDVVEAQKSLLEFGPIHVATTKMQSTLLQEIQEWMEAYTTVLYRRTLRDMERLMVVFNLLDKKLDRKIRDLEDTRISMDCLRDIRIQEVEFEMAIELVEEAIGIMMKFHVPLTEEDVERVDAVRITWHRLQQRSLDHHCHLVAIQPSFRQELLDNLTQFRVDCTQFCADYDVDGPMIQGLTPREASDRLLLFQNRFDALWRRLTSYEGGAELFGLLMPDVPELNRIRKELNLLQKLYRLYNDVIDRVAAYHDISWNSVNIEDINNELIEFQNRCRKLPKGLKEWPAFGALKRTIDEFSDLCPLLELMTNKAMKPRHWVRMTEITGHVFHVELEGFCLRQVVEAPLLQHKEDVEDVCISALKEKDIEAKLRQVTNDWTTNQLTFTTFKNRGELLLRGDSAAELISMLEDSLMVLSSLLSNRYNVPFRKQIQKWVTDLSNTNEILERWLMVQNLWVYLEAVFVGGDIAKQLPKEAKRFHKIDKSWQRMMARAHETSNVVICCVGDETLSQLLPHLQDELELCQKSLSGYLEKKRLSFPRFFFVSDPALLEILGQASDSHTIQGHLLSIFDNTACVRFHEQEYDKILAIVSTEGESIALEQPVRAEGSVEIWLMRLLQEAHRSLHSIIRLASQAIQNTEFNLLEFLAAFPSQVGILGLQMLWTRDAESALAQCRYDRKVMQETNSKFLEVLNTLIEQTTKNLDRLERIKFETLITIHVHQRDIFDQLCRSGIRSLTDFEWIKQFRFYFRAEHDEMAISITDVSFTYQNEFLGCTERLVITPLTDRCYITLAQALHMSMGGCPSGPAGTGKTETTKDMGKTLGKYVVVFNCSDQMDFRGLGRIYKGLAQSGAWGCFDEFNRIELAVLSVAAQQVAVVLACKREKRRQLVFTDGDTIDMNPEFGIFLTMNPGYAGRQQLPENLKNQFRFVSMMVPDRQIIIRVKLASCGFLENITLARKFYTLYKLCEEQLTKQVHYDFGLRNILSVLRTLGATKRGNVRDSESMIVMRVLRDMNLSKLVDEDEPLFMSLIGDLFPTTALEKTNYADLENAIREQVKAAGLIMHPPWLLKLIQLYETQLVRHGIMTLGPTGSGKTACIQILMKSLSACGQPHRELRMNPKAISAAQMFGRLDVATNDWTDGIFSALWRKTLRTKRGEHIWLVLDGPVDSLWIENLNSVLDDNRTLTLANGDRLPMSPYCKIIFEPHNIDNASPATVSRCGMVYMSSSGLDWRPLLAAWLLKRPSTEMEVLRNIFEESFAPIYQWSRQNLKYMMDVLEFNIINQALCILEGLIPNEDNEHKESTYERSNSAMGQAPDAPPLEIPELALDLKVLNNDIGESGSKSGTTPRVTRLQLERLYVFSIVWSIGAFLEIDDRIKLDAFLMAHFSHLALPPKDPESEDTVFDFVVGSDGEWDHWKNHVSPFQYPETTIIDFASMLVPNVDSVRTEFLLNTIAKQGKPVLLIGEQGSAKTVMINAYLKKHKSDYNLIRALNFSSATTTFQLQRTIEGCVDKRMGNTYGPPSGKKLTVFIDDINLPYVNEWGDQATNEIVRQLLEMKGFYSLEKPGDFTHIIDLHFVAAMIHPGGGRNDIPQRLKRHFCIFNCPLPSHTSMDKVFGTIASGHYSIKRGFSPEVRELVEKLVPLTRLLWMSTKAKMLPTPAKFHYIFNLRDLSRIWQGMSGFLCNVIDNTKVLMAAWKHEVTRVIADRFTVQSDKDWFEKELIFHVAQYLGDDFVEHVQDTQYFVDFMRDAPEPTGDETEEVDMELPKVYEPVQSFDDLQERLNMFLTQYNDMIRGHGMDLVFFQDAVEHLIKISRILRHPGGNVLLVGVGGSGKQSLTKLASFIAGYKTFHITLTRSYNVGNFLEDLKVLYRTCGIQGKGTTFIFTDQDVKEEAFLEYLNSVLSSGIVSNLFNRDEQGEIISELIPIMKREFPKRELNQENVMEYFMSRVRQHLHIALCFSPVGEKFRQRAFKFPGLTSGCTLDWFQPWPREALVAVARHFLADFTLLNQTDLLHEVENALGSIQESVAETAKEYFQRFRRSTHVTPRTYLSFLSSYKTVFANKTMEIGGMSTRIETGLAKLQEASETVEKLKMDLAEMEKELALASETAETVLVEVTHRAREAETTKNHVLLAKDRAQQLVDVIAADKAVAEQKLEAARPALEEAEAALNTIKPAHIATVRKLGRPPPLIMRIMDAVLILFQRKIQPVFHEPAMGGFKPSWNESLKMMASTSFLQQLQYFPKDSISDETVELLEPYFRDEEYNIETAKRVCGDVAGLLSWSRAMAFFFTVNKEVLPLKANLALQEVRLSAAMSELAKAEDILHEKEKALEFVTSQYDSAMADKRRLTEAAAVCRRKMGIAAALISGLSGEKLRWTLQCRAFKEQIGRLVGDAILATAFLSYAGPFNQEFRTKITQAWKKTLKNRDIPFTPTLNVSQMMSDTVQQTEWTLQGLPSDDHSIQNAVIVVRSHSYPLLIDPQGQGKNWIKAKEGMNELQTTSLNHKYFRTHLDDALSLGRPLLIEDVGEELDPVLDNLLNKNFIRAGSTEKVIIGDKDCDIMPGFTLYITTKLPNPAYTPEVSSKVTMIDFTVTQRGLEDQLLARVVSAERSDLEAERTSLFESVMENKRLIQQLEDNLLFRLTSTAGSLIDDEDLLIVLHDTKMTAQEVNHKLVVSSEMEHKINTAREEFRPVATRGSILYFLIVEMSHVNVMYQTSLKQFLHLFDGSLSKSMRTPNILERVSSVLNTLNREVWAYTLRGLYEQHQFLFTILMAIKIDLHNGAITHAEFMKLIKGGASLDLNTAPPKPYKWILDAVWLNLVELSTLHPFTDLLQQVHENEREWRSWVEKEKPEQEEIPCGYTKTLAGVAFRKLLLIRSWCPDRMLQSAQNYVIHSLGCQFMDSPLLDLEVMWSESEPRVPLICILTTCSDPSQKIEHLARQRDIEIKALSMGQGQEIHARRLLADSMTTGHWLLLQNCHLNLAFCHELLESLMEGDVHQGFRLWITTEVHPQFPISLLQTAIKFTNEPPQGIRASMKRTLTDVPQDLLDYSPSPSWPTLVYTVAFLHTVLMERRKYGPLGWNTQYEFNQSDLNGAIQCVQNHLDDMDPRKGISWPTICFMIGEAQYGGRVTDDFDKRLLLTFTSLWFSDRILASGFEFYQNYTLPTGVNAKSIAGCLDHVANLPATDSPLILGLDSNAEITYQMNRAQAILDTILSIQPKEGGNIRGSDTRESVVYRLADDMLEKMPRNYVDYEVRESLNRMGPLLPMAIFLRQEIDRMQRVILTVRKVLMDLKLAIEGTIIMSPHLLQAMDAMYDARVPEMWKGISWESSTLGFWFTEFLERNTQFTRWIFQGKPKVFWIAGFFNPQGFLTAMRQEVTRAHRGWALDSVVLQSVITRLSKEEVTDHPSEGVYIHGMYLEGASLDRKTGRLVETKGKILYEPMPVIYVYAINSTAGKDPKSYECPIYRKPIRSTTTYIGSIDLETDVNPKHWTLRGVALLCDIK